MKLNWTGQSAPALGMAGLTTHNKIDCSSDARCMLGIESLACHRLLLYTHFSRQLQAPLCCLRRSSLCLQGTHTLFCLALGWDSGACLPSVPWHAAHHCPPSAALIQISTLPLFTCSGAARQCPSVAASRATWRRASCQPLPVCSMPRSLARMQCRPLERPFQDFFRQALPFPSLLASCTPGGVLKAPAGPTLITTSVAWLVCETLCGRSVGLLPATSCLDSWHVVLTVPRCVPAGHEPGMALPRDV